MEYPEVYRALSYPSISNESFSETFKRVIDALIARIKRYLNNIIDYFTYDVKLDHLLLTTRRLKEATYSRGISTDSKYITINTRIRTLTVNYKPLTNVRSLTLALGNLVQNSQTFYGYKENLLNNPKLVPEVGLGYHRYTKSSQGLTSTQLLGSKQIFIQPGSPATMIDANGVVAEIPSEFEFERMTQPNTRELLEGVHQLLTKAKDHYTGAKLVKRKKALETAIKELESLKANSESNDRVFNLTLFTSNLNALELDIYKLNISAATAILNLAEANLNAK